MFHFNRHDDYGRPLDPADAAMLGPEGLAKAERFLAQREDHAVTPMHTLPRLAAELRVGAIHVKDEGQRLGLGSFKALGGAYAVACLALDHAAARLGRPVDMSELTMPDVRALAQDLTFACATDGNHGRSVAQGAAFVGAKSKIFIHSGVSDGRAAAIAGFGAEIIRVTGTYDDSVAEAARVADEKGWAIVSDTSWPGYEHIPGLVAQGYTALVGEALRQLAEPPTHVFVQAGVGGIAAAVAGHLALRFGAQRPKVIVVEPARAACLYATAAAGHLVKVPHGEPTVMAMLECYEPSRIAWRVLARVADCFMTVEEEDAVDIMNRLARPLAGDPAIVAGESGGVGLAGLIRVMRDPSIAAQLQLDRNARIFVINTEGATDPMVYRTLVGKDPQEIAATIARGTA
ncbi:diaminopropionate ammonia-lyase [Methylovirgula sp. 4M-Z18]|uniref:diaminopropionate ammonia-lyase n=1 Tax=Methylovirgula sp. 4M-Z18 TaxID=2293567 RepID=UPI000E2EABA6|nr:diaminopropionate ammonia-lyase [Methylovirgula sp. 4M-Z18]RFB79632.1 diaminopropionate ammonia-lyase [Methylovirgula sp. 4M-Z18]